MESINLPFKMEDKKVLNELICGAKVQEGQFMCMECGRAIQF